MWLFSLKPREQRRRGAVHTMLLVVQGFQFTDMKGRVWGTAFHGFSTHLFTRIELAGQAYFLLITRQALAFIVSLSYSC